MGNQSVKDPKKVESGYHMEDRWNHQITLLGHATKGLHLEMADEQLDGEGIHNMLCLGGEGHARAEDCDSEPRLAGSQERNQETEGRQIEEETVQVFPCQWRCQEAGSLQAEYDRGQRQVGQDVRLRFNLFFFFFTSGRICWILLKRRSLSRTIPTDLTGCLLKHVTKSSIHRGYRR